MIISKTKIKGMCQQRQALITLQDWSLLGMGQGHIILKNDDQKDELFWKVMMVCIHQIATIPQQLQDIYYEIIESISNIKEYLLKKQGIVFNQEGREYLRTYVKKQLKINKQIPKNYMVFLAENLNRSKHGWQFSLQFKPKTPLPDKYSTQFIQAISKQAKIDVKTIETILNNRPSQQKTRWFKKNCQKTIKKNMNPLQVFDVKMSNYPIFIDRLKIIETSEQQILTNQQAKILNQKIFFKMRQRQILNAILSLQLLFNGPSDSLGQLSSTWSKQANKGEILGKIKQNIEKQLLNNKQNSLIQNVQKLLDSTIIDDSQNHQYINAQQYIIEQIMKFLISWSWRDISLFIRLKINEVSLQIEDIDYNIIDYELKQSSKLITTKEKDHQFLMKYLSFLNLL